MRLFLITWWILAGAWVHAEPIRIAWLGLSRPWTKNLVERYISDPELEQPLLVSPPKEASKESPKERKCIPDPVEEDSCSQAEGFNRAASKFAFSQLPASSKLVAMVDEVPISSDAKPNPFHITSNDFAVGDSLPWPPTRRVGDIPSSSAADLSWFSNKANESPDVLILAGHHVISEGFHNDQEDKFLFIPHLAKTLASHAPARSYFGHIKLAILFACNTLTNLEPHHDDGSVMSPDEIRRLYMSDMAGRDRVIGAPSVINSLEFYKRRLATEYGPGMPEYAYTRDPKAENCSGPGQFDNCHVANLDRILPESGLYDGSHRYNEALTAQNLFPGAYLVLGFSSASPSEELRVQILQAAVKMADKELELKNQNVIKLIVDPATSDADRRRAVMALRTAWETVTYKMNRHRPSGSITPAYPDIDGGYVMTLRQTADQQLYSKYR